MGKLVTSLGLTQKSIDGSGLKKNKKVIIKSKKWLCDKYFT